MKKRRQKSAYALGQAFDTQLRALFVYAGSADILSAMSAKFFWE